MAGKKTTQSAKSTDNTILYSRDGDNTMDEATLQQILKDHRLWVNSNGSSGKRADLSRANLSGADLSHANLYGADLSHADLSRANLYGANLSGASLSHANLSGASLSGADLSHASLSHASLSGANLPHAVYQFFSGKFNAVATPTELRIGCEVHPWDVWLDEKKRGEIANSAKFTDKEFEIHSELITVFHKLLVK